MDMDKNGLLSGSSKIDWYLKSGIKLKTKENIKPRILMQMSTKPHFLRQVMTNDYIQIYSHLNIRKSFLFGHREKTEYFAVLAFLSRYTHAQNNKTTLEIYFGKINGKLTKTAYDKFVLLNIEPDVSLQKVMDGDWNELSLYGPEGNAKKYGWYFDKGGWREFIKLNEEIKKYIFDLRRSGKMTEVPWDFDGENIIADLTEVIK